MSVSTELPRVASREEWLAARIELLRKEKELTRARDALSAERRRLPMVKIEKDYRFQTVEGERRLVDLFEGRRQLVVHHFMWVDEADEGCKGCSMQVDTIGDLPVHLRAANTTLAFVSRAPLAKLEAYRARMGWSIPLISSAGSDFNYDFHATLDPRRGATTYNFRDVHATRRLVVDVRGRHAGGERVPARRARRVPHVLGVRAWHGAGEQPVRLPRLHAARPPGRQRAAELGASPRSVRGGAGGAGAAARARRFRPELVRELSEMVEMW